MHKLKLKNKINVYNLNNTLLFYTLKIRASSCTVRLTIFLGGGSPAFAYVFQFLGNRSFFTCLFLYMSVFF